MKIRLIALPHHLGQKYPHQETGPVQLLAADAVGTIARAGFDVDSVEIACEETYPDEHSAVRELSAAVARSAIAATNDDRLPIVLSGNCATCLGALATLGPRGGAVWFDAHGDFNTPETSPSGMIDGMPLAVAVGRCYPDVLAVVREQPLAESRVMLAGVRAPDAAEIAAIDEAGIPLVSAADIGRKGGAEAVRGALEAMARQTDEVYIHLDLDGVDPGEAPGVGYRTADGVSEADLSEVIGEVSRHVRISSCGIAAYDPHHDHGDVTRSLAIRLALAVAEAASADSVE